MVKFGSGRSLVTNTWLMVLCLSILCFKSLEILMVKFCSGRSACYQYMADGFVSVYSLL
jgi:hypothetical protein